VSQRRGATSHFVLADALGSVVGLSNASQSVSDSYRYKAYGLPLITTGSTTNPFRWVGTLGYYYDASSGRYYVRARHYGPVIARWLSEDPIGFEGSQWNLYEYVNSLPTNGVDPAGNLTINYIPGRLALIDATIVPNNFPKLSSAFDVAWRVNNAAFWTTIDCERRKLCDEIGIFQIVKGSANQTGWGVPLLGTWASLNYSWQIDSIDPDPAYGQPSSKLGGVVRGDPTEIKILSAEDVPGVDPGRPVFYGQYLNFYSLHAETYPVCLKGIEGPKFEAIEGPFIFGTRISSVTVYGPGVTWYHSFTLKGTKWKADRRVTSKNARPGGNFREALQKWFDKFWYVVT